MSKSKDLVDALSGGKLRLPVSLLSDDNSPCIVSEWLPSGCLSLDKILGGGFPVGRITEIFGDTSTGKSLIAAQVIALAQQDGHICVLADTETATSLPIMQAVGVDPDNLVYAAPDTMEDVFTIFENAILSKPKDSLLLLVWDSVAASSTRREMENEYGKASMGGGANILSQALRKITRMVGKQRVCGIFLNQVREKIGVMFGDNETTYGGKALPYYASVRLRLKLGQKIKSGKKIVGLSTRASCVKNKVAMPFLGCELPIYFGHGIDDPEATLLYLKASGLVTGATHKHITINGEDCSFTSSNWPDLYDAQYDAIADIIMTHDADSDEVFDDATAD